MTSTQHADASSSATWASARPPAVHPEPAQPRLRQPAAAQAAAGRACSAPTASCRPTFWPDEEGKLTTLKESLKPLEPFKDRTLILHGVCDKVRGDGDNHMRGIGCLLTGVELFPGNIQGGSRHAGRLGQRHLHRSGDQEPPASQPGHAHALRLAGVRRHGARPRRHLDAHGLRRRRTSRSRRSTIPTRCSPSSTAGCKDQENLEEHPRRLAGRPAQGRARRSAPRTAGCSTSTPLRPRDGAGTEGGQGQDVGHAVPELEPGVKHENDNIPRISKMQIDLMVNSFAADFARVATLQFTNSVGEARMRWLEDQRRPSRAVARARQRQDGPGQADARSTSGTASSWPTWRSAWPRRRSRAAAAACSTTR